MRKLKLGLPATGLGLALLLGVELLPAAEPFPALAPPAAARVISAPINEMSGMVKSRKAPDRYWVHNDSGDTARIFAITSEGRSILPTYAKFTRYGDEKEAGKEQWEGFPLCGKRRLGGDGYR